jgi:stage V sporulation protein B
MDKAQNMGKTSATGSFQLLLGVVGSTVIMALGTIILGVVLSREDLGIYYVALIPSGMINFFRDWGVNSAMTKQIASLRAANREPEIHDVIVSGVIFEIISGVILSLGCFALAGPLAAFLVPTESVANVTVLISVMSASILAGAVVGAAGAIFVGYERMMLSSFTTVLQAIVKTAVGPILVVIGFGVFGAVVGATLSFVAGGVTGLIIVYLVLLRPLRNQKEGRCNIIKTLKPMLSYGLPLTVSNTVVGVSPMLFAFFMAPVATPAIMGDYTAGSYFNVLITFFTLPISMALFPIFAKVNAVKEPELLKTVFASSVKYTSVLVVPATGVIMSLANPIVNTIWPDKFPNAPLFLALSAMINLYVVIGYISLGTFMTGLGETKWLMAQSVLSLIWSIPILAFLYFGSGMLSPLAGAIVGIVGILLSALPGMIWGLVWVWHRYRVKANFGASAKILLSAALAGGVAFFVSSLSQNFLGGLGLSLRISSMVSLAVGFVLFLGLYLCFAPLLGAVNQADIGNLRLMFSGVGLVSKILSLPLRLMEKILGLRKKPTLQQQKPENGD